MIKAALEAQQETHRTKMDALLAAHREQAAAQQVQTVVQQAERERQHKEELNAMLETQQRQFAAQISESEKSINLIYEARFYQLESIFTSASTSHVTRLMDVPDTKSPASLVVKSSVASGLGKYILFFKECHIH